MSREKCSQSANVLVVVSSLVNRCQSDLKTSRVGEIAVSGSSTLMVVVSSLVNRCQSDLKTSTP